MSQKEPEEPENEPDRQELEAEWAPDVEQLVRETICEAGGIVKINQLGTRYRELSRSFWFQAQ